MASRYTGKSISLHLIVSECIINHSGKRMGYANNIKQGGDVVNILTDKVTGSLTGQEQLAGLNFNKYTHKILRTQ